MSDLWSRIERILPQVERPSRYIDREWGARDPEGSCDYSVVLAYPDAYEIGMANQAIGILYGALNSMDGVSAERCYVPWVDMAAAMRAEGLPLFRLESCLPVRDSDLFGITLPHELTYTNVLELLDLARIPLRAEDRTDDDPLVVGGGPCAFNPEPLAAFFDAFFIGEAEEGIGELVSTLRRAKRAGASREATLHKIAKLEGVYVPSFYSLDGEGVARPHGDAPTVVTKRVPQALGGREDARCPIVPYAEVVHDRATVEILRGCTRGCRFCQAGMVYRPVRELSEDAIVREALARLRCTGLEEVSLTSLSSSDHSRIANVLRRMRRRLEGTAVSISLPSLRVDAFGVELARLASAGGRKSGLTLAPEAGTQRLRDSINKRVTEEDLLEAVSAAFSQGWRRVKLYFMIGLPSETDEDVVGIANVVQRVLQVARESVSDDQRGSVKVAVSVSTFVPKPHTPFQWDGQIPPTEVARRQGLLRSAMPRKGVDLSWHDPETSLLEAVLARGGRECAEAIEEAWRSGAVFDAWSERFDLDRWLGAMTKHGIDAVGAATAERPEDARLPWEHISCGVSKDYLLRERARARAGETTPDCAFEACTGCDVCGDLGVEIDLDGVRVGRQ